MSELKEYRARSRLYIVGDESENEDENTHKGVVCLQNLIYGTIFALIVYRLIGTEMSIDLKAPINKNK